MSLLDDIRAADVEIVMGMKPQAERDTKMEDKTIRYMSQSKSMSAGILLTVFLGPLGLIYVSPLGGAILILVSIFTLGLLYIPAHIISIVWACIAIPKHNRQLADKINYPTLPPSA